MSEDQIAATLGAAAGSFVTAVGVTWAALVRPLQKKVAEQPGKEVTLDVGELKQKLRDLERRIETMEKAQEKVNERLRHVVTDDEFQTYVQSTNTSIQGMTEKIGQARGAIELWLSRGK